MKIKKIILIATSVSTLILEILPYGAVCIFANPEGASWRRTYSYFDLTPYGYANFAPFIVALLTCTLLILNIISLLLKRSLRKTIIVISAIATVLSLAPLLYGVEYFTLTGVLIFIMLSATTVIAIVKEKCGSHGREE